MKEAENFNFFIGYGFMKQIFSSPDRGFVVEEVPAPVCLKGGVLVKNHFSAISVGTELSSAKSTQRNSLLALGESLSLYKKALNKMVNEGFNATFKAIDKYKATLWPKGYSSAGEIIEIGADIVDLKPGDFVACAGSGFAVHAEYVTVPRNLVARIPAGIELQYASFATIGSIAMHAVRQASPGLGENVAVVGLGIIGLLVVQLLKSCGCKVLAIDINPSRTELARDSGADEIYCPTESDDVVEKVLHFSNYVGMDVVMMCAATISNEPVNQAMQFLRRKGKLVIVGDVGLGFKRSPFYEKEIDIKISCSYGPGRYDPVYELEGREYPIDYVRWTLNRNLVGFMELVGSGKVDLDLLITHKTTIDKAPEVYNNIKGKKIDSLGVLIDYEVVSKNKAFSRVTPVQFEINPEHVGTINVGVIGAGSFAQRQHIPNLLSAGVKCKLQAVCTRNGASAKQIAQVFKAGFCTTDYHEIINSPEIDAIVVATRHDSHAQIATDAVKAGKHVLLEKPMAINRDELDCLKKTVLEGKVVFTVGFNRRYSPVISDTIKVLEKLPKPYHILYRVNAGKIAANHWTQQRNVGGGRIIGEGCHFIDLIKYLVGENICDVSVGLAAAKNFGETYDSVSANLHFTGGSLGTLLYTALGSSKLGKESIEIHAGSTSIFINDFRSLKIVGNFEKEINYKSIDKGWKNEMNLFLTSILGKKNNLVSLEDAVEVTEVSLAIDKMLRTGR
ncbi:MAG: oxidoreductase [Deltaproteobacteria bacterium]|nr:MAG: oxidoreductase [Deltaproteobacteria bacterium]